MQLTHKDIWLDFFISCQRLIQQLNSGDKLQVDGVCCHNMNRQVVLRFSASFVRQIEYMNQRGYVPTAATVSYIVFWQKEDAEREIRIVLPEVTFSRIHGDGSLISSN
jgi:ATP-dependent DNA helicase RecQ